MVFMYDFFFCEKCCPDLHVDVLSLFSSISLQNQVTDTNRKLQNEGKEVSDTFIHSILFLLFNYLAVLTSGKLVCQ